MTAAAEFIQPGLDNGVGAGGEFFPIRWNIAILRKRVMDHHRCVDTAETE